MNIPEGTIRSNIQPLRQLSAGIDNSILVGNKLNEQIIRILPYALSGNTSRLGVKMANLVSTVAGQSIGKWLGKLIGGGIFGGVAGLVVGGFAGNLIGNLINKIFGLGKRKAPELKLPLAPIVDRSLNPDKYTLDRKWSRNSSGSSSMPPVNIQLTGVVGNEYEVVDRIAEQLAGHLKLRQMTSGSRFGGA